MGSLRGMLRLYNIIYICTMTARLYNRLEHVHVRGGLNQGSALSPLLFILMMDVLKSDIGKDPP